MSPSSAKPSATMVIAHPDLLHHAGQPAPEDPVTLVALPASVTPSERMSTICLHWDRLGTLDALTRTADSTRQITYRCDGTALFDGLRPGPALHPATQLAGSAGGTAQHVPAFCATVTTAGLDLFSRVRFYPGEALFLRTTQQPLPAPVADDLGWLEVAIRLHAEHAGALNSHERHYRKALAGTELEYKITLPRTAPIWAIAADVHHQVASGSLPGMVLCHRDDLQVWDFHNHLYEVTAPADQVGYVSFLSTSDNGVYRLKRKRFTTDRLARHEDLSPEIRPEMPLADYVRDVLGLHAAPLPPFRRIRYDISVESPATGHLFGIFLDRCHLLDALEIVLAQCEIEYLNTRTVFPPDERQVLTGLEKLTTWTEHVLTGHDIPATRGYYSKLSFLRDVVTAHPGLAAPTAQKAAP